MANDSPWTQLSLQIPAESCSEFSALFWEMETIGLEESPLPDGSLELTVYFEGKRSSLDLTADFQRMAGQRGLAWSKLRASRINLRPQDWLAKWRESFTGFPLGKRAWVHPPWEEPATGRSISLTLEPGQAFGTGTHPSTQLCWELMEPRLSCAGSLLDVGTGSGILALGAAKLQPELQVAALDIDPIAVRAARENLKMNQVESVQLLAGSIEALRPGLRFDLVVANLALGIFREVAVALAQRAGQSLILSGFTTDQSAEVRQIFAAQEMKEFSTRTRDDWEALMFKPQISNPK